MKIAVLVSGGVDSSVALKLLQDQGHEVVAFYLKIWLEDEMAYLGNCPWEEDLDYVRKVCEQLGVELRVISLQKEYWDKVVSYAISEVKMGRTPNPDMMCNMRVKFGAFYDKIDDSFEKVATGHYAKVVCEGGIYKLMMTPDPIKDQTYFLAHLSQKQLSRAMFPISDYTKKEVRELANKFDLPNKDRKDSQGICFLGKIKYTDFLKANLGEMPGNICEFETGEVLGGHKGFWLFTIGQRFGLGLSGGPWFVVKKDVKNNVVYVSKKYDEVDYPRDVFKVGEFNWISDAEVGSPIELKVKLRHGEGIYDCEIRLGEDGIGLVKISGKDQGLAPGQFAVFYRGEQCLGCGKIL